jgi:uncharacterized protein (TIGR00252 family)
MSTTGIGNEAEAVATDYLKSQGFSIKTKNWRTRWCEIDIVAIQSKIVYLCEVKYRKNSTWGDGLEAITTKKLQQMTFAAELWVQNNNWRGDYRLLVISVSGQPPEVENLIEL